MYKNNLEKRSKSKRTCKENILEKRAKSRAIDCQFATMLMVFGIFVSESDIIAYSPGTTSPVATCWSKVPPTFRKTACIDHGVSINGHMGTRPMFVRR